MNQMRALLRSLRTRSVRDCSTGLQRLDDARPDKLMGVLAAIGVTFLATSAFAQATFYIDEATVFEDAHGCTYANNLNSATATLKGTLEYNGWTGVRYANVNAWPQDFMESCSTGYGAGGLDSTYGDTKLLTVYAGHGNKGMLAWGYAHDGVCQVRFQNNLRLGSMNGSSAGYAMYVTSCTLHLSSLVDQANWQWVRQQFGYHNSPSVGDDSASEFFDGTFGDSNKDSWLDHMEDRPYWFTGDNSPVVVSYGSTSSDCMNTHNNARLGGNVLRSPRGGGPSCSSGQPAFFYATTIRDHGDEGCQ